MSLILQKIDIDRGYFAKATDPLKGEVTFRQIGDNADKRVEIKIQLDEELSAQIVGICGMAIARAGQKAAENLASAARLAYTGKALIEGIQEDAKEEEAVEAAEVVGPDGGSQKGTDQTSDSEDEDDIPF